MERTALATLHNKALQHPHKPCIRISLQSKLHRKVCCKTFSNPNFWNQNAVFDWWPKYKPNLDTDSLTTWYSSMWHEGSNCSVWLGSGKVIWGLPYGSSELLSHHTGQVQRPDTDGSKHDKKVRCAVVYDGRFLREHLPDTASVYTAELRAIYLAVHHAVCSTRDKFVVYVDSRSCLPAIEGLHIDYPLVPEIL